MANEKIRIRCKKCRKRFEPDLYSSLCPKCGTYNGRRMDSSELELYISGGDQEEKEHRTLLNGKPVKISALPVFFLALVITILISVVIVTAFGIFWNATFLRETKISEAVAAAQPVPGKAVFDQELLESPITIEVHQAGIVEAVKELEGKSIYGILVSGGSENYNFDARVTGVFLQYEFEGDIYYKMPLDSYSLEEFCKEHNIWEDDILHAYGLGNGETKEGYYFFLADSKAENYSLLLQLTRSEEPSVVLQEALIDLESFQSASCGTGR